MRMLTVLAAIWASLAMASAQTDVPFRGTISNLGTEPPPYVPAPTVVEEPPSPVPPAKPIARPVAVAKPAVPTEEQRASTFKKAKAEGAYPTWLANPQAQSSEGASYAPPSRPEKPKLTKAQKWGRALLIMGAVAGQVAVVRTCQQLRAKPLIQYRGADLQNLRWCEQHGY